VRCISGTATKSSTKAASGRQIAWFCGEAGDGFWVLLRFPEAWIYLNGCRAWLAIRAFNWQYLNAF